MDYGVLFARMERLRLSDEEWQEVFEDVTAIEAAAVKAINAKNKT